MITDCRLTTYRLNSSSLKSECGSERSGIPKRLPLKLRPFLGKMTERFAHPGGIQGRCFPIDSKIAFKRTRWLRHQYKTISYYVITFRDVSGKDCFILENTEVRIDAQWSGEAPHPNLVHELELDLYWNAGSKRASRRGR
jgi:hypothetical protein